MSVYLADHPPARRQFYTTRKATVSGAIVVHTAENLTDVNLPDDGAEAVASFIRTRSNPGSYHEIIDSDSHVQLCRYEWQAFGEATGGNRWALHLSFACRAAQWPNLSDSWKGSAMHIGAQRAAKMAAWVKSTTGIIIPGKRITAAEYRAQKPGFIGHGELDPGRRTDPGAGFPWAIFLNAYRNSPTSPIDPDNNRPIPATPLHLHEAVQEVEAIYRARRGYDAEGQPRYTGAEIHAWRLDLHEKIYNLGENVRPTLAYIDWALANEPPTEGTPT